MFTSIDSGEREVWYFCVVMAGNFCIWEEVECVWPGCVAFAM